MTEARRAAGGAAAKGDTAQGEKGLVATKNGDVASKAGGAEKASRPEKPEPPPPPKRVFKRAQELAREAVMMLKKRGKKVPPESVTEVTVALEAVQKLLADKAAALANPNPLLKASIDLDQGIQKHFGKWRKSQFRELVEAILWALALAGFIKFFLIEAFSIPSPSMYPTLEIGDHLFINKIGYGLYVPFSPKRMIEWSQPERGDIIVFEYHYPETEHPSPLVTHGFSRREVLPPPDEMDGEDFIKRVIGLPGDRVRLVDNRIVLNGVPIQTESLGPSMCDMFSGQDNNRTSVGKCPCVKQRETIGDASWVSQHFVEQCGNQMPPQPNWPLDRPQGGWPYMGAKNGANPNPDFPDVVVPEGHVFVMGDNRDASKDGRYWGFVPFNRIKGKAFVIWLNWGDMSRFGTWLD